MVIVSSGVGQPISNIGDGYIVQPASVDIGMYCDRSTLAPTGLSKVQIIKYSEASRRQEEYYVRHEGLIMTMRNADTAHTS
jgi:hypothetical protein